jgi:hypothetical protein
MEWRGVRSIVARRREPMGAVEDVRKPLQDIVAPDLKALQVEVREGFASVEKGFAAVIR